MKRRRFIINTGLGALGLYLAPNLMSCSNKKAVELDTVLGKSVSILSESDYLNKEGNEDFGYYHFDENNFKMEKYKAKEAFIFYKNSKVIGYTLKIEGNDFFKQGVENISKVMKNYTSNYKNDFGEELQWSHSGKVIKLSFNNYKDLPQLTFYTEILEDNKLII